MGILKHLLAWPVTGPKYLIDFSLQRVGGVVRQELTDDTPVKEQLLELQLLLELGDIDEDEYVEREAEIMDQLREVRRWREEFGMATRGPVKVAGGEESHVEDAREPHGTAAGADSRGAHQVDREEKTPDVASPSDASVEIHFDVEDDEEAP